jgi:hypothetical protein
MAIITLMVVAEVVVAEELAAQLLFLVGRVEDRVMIFPS